MKIPISTITVIVVFALSIIVWAFFYRIGMPLTTEETAGIILMFTIIAFLAAKIINKKRGGKNDKKS